MQYTIYVHINNWLLTSVEKFGTLPDMLKKCSDNSNDLCQCPFMIYVTVPLWLMPLSLYDLCQCPFMIYVTVPLWLVPLSVMNCATVPLQIVPLSLNDFCHCPFMTCATVPLWIVPLSLYDFCHCLFTVLRINKTKKIILGTVYSFPNFPTSSRKTEQFSCKI